MDLIKEKIKIEKMKTLAYKTLSKTTQSLIDIVELENDKWNRLKKGEYSMREAIYDWFLYLKWNKII